jgi:ABC-2 type transport system ATP-binding protein
MEPILELKNVYKAYPGFKLDDVSFSLERGKVMGLIGPNGAGKTTTIKLVMGLAAMDSGVIRAFGLDLHSESVEMRKRIGVVYDACDYWPNLRPEEIGRILAPFYPRWDAARFAKSLTDFGLPPDKKLSTYSKGMKTKFSLAAALSCGAELVILDEPTSGLDPAARAEILDILRDFIQDESRSVLFSTHLTADLERIADELTLIEDGRIVFSENKDEVLARHAIVKGPLAALTPELEARLVGLKKGAHGFEALAEDADAMRKLSPSPCAVDPASIDDIMVFRSRENEREE